MRPLRFYGHPLSSYCWKLAIALRESGLEYEESLVDLTDPAARARFIRDLSPMGKMPVLVDGDRAVWETSIALEYLADTFPSAAWLRPAAPARAREVRLWDRFLDLYVHAPMQQIVGDRIRPADQRDAYGVARAREQLRCACEVVERRISGRTWIGDDEFTMADCAAAPALYYADRVAPLAEAFPQTRAYLRRLVERPSFQRVLADAEPYAHLFPRG